MAFLANRYGPEGVHSINLQIVLLAVELLDFIRCKWDCAGNSLEALVYKGVDGDAKTMIRLGFD